MEGVTSEMLVNVTPRLTKNRANFRRIKTNSLQSVKRWEKENELLYAMIEDECEWLSKLFPDIVITPEFFFFALEDGTVLCRLANYIQEAAQLWGEEHGVPVPGKKLRYNSITKKRGMKESQLFRSRENVQMFLSWCRSQNISEAILFESNDVVEVDEGREGSREVVICLMEIARRAVKYDLDEVPQLIQLEKEIDAEEELDAQNSRTNEDEQGQVLNVEEVNAESEEEAEFEDSPEQHHEELEQDSEQESIRSPSSVGGGSDSGVEMVIEDCNGIQNANGPEKPRKDHEGDTTRTSKRNKTVRKDSSIRKKGTGTSLQDTKTPKSELDKQICKIAESYNIQIVHRLKEGKYIILGRVMFVRMLNGHLLVRIGGGWDTLEHYIMTHVPKGSDGVNSSQSPTASTPRAREKELNTPHRDTPSAGCRASAPILGQSGSPVIFRQTPGKKRSFDEDEKDLTEAIRKLSSSVEQNLATVGLSKNTSKSLLNLKNRFDIRRGSGPEANRRATSLENLTPVRKAISAKKISASLASFNNNNYSKSKMADVEGTEFVNGAPLSEDQVPHVNNGFQDVQHDEQISFDGTYISQTESRTVTETHETSETTDGGIVTQTTTITKTEFSSNVDADQRQQILDFGFNSDIGDSGAESHEVSKDEFMTFTNAEQTESAQEGLEQTEFEEKQQHQFVEAELVPETQSDKEPEPQLEDVRGAPLELEPEAHLEPEPEAQLEREPEAQLEREPEAQLELEPEAQSELEPESQTEPEPETLSEREPEALLELGPEAQMELEPAAQSEPEPEAHSELEPETQLKVEDETKPELLVEPDGESEQLKPEAELEEQELQHEQHESAEAETTPEPLCSNEEPEGFISRQNLLPGVPLAEPEKESYEMDPLEYAQDSNINMIGEPVDMVQDPRYILKEDEVSQVEEEAAVVELQQKEVTGGAEQQSVPEDEQLENSPLIEEFQHTESESYQSVPFEEKAKEVPIESVLTPEESIPVKFDEDSKPAVEIPEPFEVSSPSKEETEPVTDEESKPTEEARLLAESLIKIAVEDDSHQAEETSPQEAPQQSLESHEPVEHITETEEIPRHSEESRELEISQTASEPFEEVPQSTVNPQQLEDNTQQEIHEPIQESLKPLEELSEHISKDELSQPPEDLKETISVEVQDISSPPEPTRETVVEPPVPAEVAEKPVDKVSEPADTSTTGVVPRPKTLPAASKKEPKKKADAKGAVSGTKSTVKSPIKSPTKSPTKSPSKEPVKKTTTTLPGAKTASKPAAASESKKEPLKKVPPQKTPTARPSSAKPAAKKPAPNSASIAGKPRVPSAEGKDAAGKKTAGVPGRPASATARPKPMTGKEPSKKTPGITAAPLNGKARPSAKTSKAGNEVTSKPAGERPSSAKPHMTVAKKTVTKTVITKSGTGPSKVQKTTTEEKVETKNGTKTTTVNTRTTATGKAPKSTTTVKTTRSPLAAGKTTRPPSATKKTMDSKPGSKPAAPIKSTAPASRDKKPATGSRLAAKSKPGSAAKPTNPKLTKPSKQTEATKDETPSVFESSAPFESDVVPSSVVTKQVTETVVVNGQAISTVTTTETTVEGTEETTLVASETIEGNLLEI